MREARYVGVSGDGAALVVACGGEHLRVPIDRALREALGGAGGDQLAIPVEAPLSPREIQDRIRHGATAAQLAEATGVPLEQVARFEGAVLAERAYRARLARANRVEGRRLDDVVREHLAQFGVGEEEARWDAWRRDDGWLVEISWHEGERVRTARWMTHPGTDRAVSIDAGSQAMLRTAAVTDELTAVLRPLYGERTRRPAPEPDLEPARPSLVAEPVEAAGPEPAEEPAVAAEPAERPGFEAVAEPVEVAESAVESAEEVDEAAAEPPAAARPRPAAGTRKRRPAVPSWDEIAALRPRG